MTLIKNHEFALSWWPITKDLIKIPKAQKDDPNILAWTINGASPSEIKLIQDWCAKNGARAFKPVKWGDGWHDSSKTLYVGYTNNEMTVITDQHTGSQLASWLKSLPQRNAAVLLEDVTLSQLKRWTTGYNARIIPDLHKPRRYVISVASDELAVELALRSD